MDRRGFLKTVGIAFATPIVFKEIKPYWGTNRKEITIYKTAALGPTELMGRNELEILKYYEEYFRPAGVATLNDMSPKSVVNVSHPGNAVYTYLHRCKNIGESNSKYLLSGQKSAIAYYEKREKEYNEGIQIYKRLKGKGWI